MKLALYNENFLTNLETQASKPLVGGSFEDLLKLDRRGKGWQVGKNKTTPDVPIVVFDTTTWQKGYICFAKEQDKPIASMVSVDKDMPEKTSLPDISIYTDRNDRNKKASWHECVEISGVTVIDGDVTPIRYATSSVGGLKAMQVLLNDFVAHLQENGVERPYPVVGLGQDSYDHSSYGETFFPVFKVLDWIDEVTILPNFTSPEEEEDVEEVKVVEAKTLRKRRQTKQ